MMPGWHCECLINIRHRYINLISVLQRWKRIPVREDWMMKVSSLMKAFCTYNVSVEIVIVHDRDHPQRYNPPPALINQSSVWLWYSSKIVCVTSEENVGPGNHGSNLIDQLPRLVVVCPWHSNGGADVILRTIAHTSLSLHDELIQNIWDCCSGWLWLRRRLSVIFRLSWMIPISSNLGQAVG